VEIAVTDLDLVRARSLRRAAARRAAPARRVARARFVLRTLAMTVHAQPAARSARRRPFRLRLTRGTIEA
jgi:hypothetical protein